MFSVIIPLYNKAPYIQRAIDSVLNQSFQEFEIIVINDGSTDGGEKLMETYQEHKITLLHQENQGVSVARNTGIEKAKYTWLAFLDADDVWHKDYLYLINQVIQKDSEVKMLGSSYSNLALPGSIENPTIELIKDYYYRAISNTLFTSSSTVIHRSFFEYNLGFKSHIIRGEDIDVWFRAYNFFEMAAYIHEPLVFYDLVASSSLETSPKIEQTILFEIYNQDYLSIKSSSVWADFRDKYLLLNLFLFFDKEENFKKGKALLNQRSRSYFFAEVPYLFPYALIKLFISSTFSRKLIRKYLKFCFRFIYS